MCLIFFAIRKHPKYKFILAGNRDEFYNRRTASAAFWDDHSNVLGGRDLEASGTWLGMTREGRISTLTNYRDPANINPAAPSRGKLVADYLVGNDSAANYIKSVSQEGVKYNGFNLLVGDANSLWYYSNYGEGIRELKEGIFGLSNHLLNTPWPKVTRGKEKFSRLLSDSNLSAEELMDLLYDDVIAEDHLLPNTGLPLDRERALSSMFIKTSNYGSRCSTIILIDHDDNVIFNERVFDVTNFQYQTNQFEFRLLAVPISDQSL